MNLIQGSGSIVKKCSCSVKTKCAHGWTLRYWLDGKQREKTFRDVITDGRPKPGSGKKLAQDFALKLATGKREGDTTFADKSKGAIPFVTYAETWISGRRPVTTRQGHQTTLSRPTGRDAADVTITPCWRSSPLRVSSASGTGVAG